jgi:uncharacterized Zn-binding protein involved in type VI secretion
MPPASRLGDKANVPADAHGCPACPHPGIGPAVCGSEDVMTNSRPAFRKDDTGVHAACCNQNTWKAVQGSGTVFINNKEAVRLGDQTKHCGGSGNMIEGSNNVMIGGAAGSGGGGGSGGGSSSTPGGGGTQGAQGSQSGTNSNQTGSGSAKASDAATNDEAPANEAANDEPQPVLVSAKWSQDRVPVSTEVTLSAICAEMSGKSATFTIKDADDDTKTIATVSGSCGDAKVEATWTTPKDGPPGRFVFTVAADGKEAVSGVLTMINAVEVKLFLDEEPAKGIRVKLRADPSGEIVNGEADDQGVVKFEEAPFGDYTLILDDGEGS